MVYSRFYMSRKKCEKKHKKRKVNRDYELIYFGFYIAP